MERLSVKTLARAGEGGYERYRIPGIAALPDGTMLVFYEARHGGDWSVIDLYAQRSDDLGRTWGPRQMLFSGQGKNTVNNPVMIPDGERLHFLCLENYKRLFHRLSRDGGMTWTEPREITSSLDSCRDIWPWTCAAVGPDHGLRLESGRLIASVWLASDPADVFAHGPAKVSTLWSDDGGAAWRLGQVFQPEGSVSPNEACLAELPDGRVLMNIRTVRRSGGGPHCRCLAVSPDGISRWGETRFEPGLPDPACFGSMCNFPGGILFTNCDSSVSRARHTLRISRDGGRTWPEALMYEPLAGYSDCCYNPVSRTVFTFYEYEAETELRVSEIAL